MSIRSTLRADATVNSFRKITSSTINVANTTTNAKWWRNASVIVFVMMLSAVDAQFSAPVGLGSVL
jgi:hypothetical protein